MKQTLKAALPSLAMPAVISLQLWVLTAGNRLGQEFGSPGFGWILVGVDLRCALGLPQ